MRLVYVTERFPFGSGEAFLLPEISELMRRGHEVLIVPLAPRGKMIHCNDDRIAKRVVAEPLLSYRVLGSAFFEVLRHPIRMLKPVAWYLESKSIWKMGRNIRAHPKGIWLSRVAREWSADHIHAHWAVTSATIAMVASEVTGIPWSLTAHRYDIVANDLLELKAVKAAFVRFISESGLGLAAKYAGVPKSAKTFVLPMGIDLPSRTSRRVSKNSTFHILCPANLVPVKGHTILLVALATLVRRGYSVRLSLAGDGPLRSNLEEQVAKLGITGNVEFLGHLPHKQLMRMYEANMVDVVALASLDLGNGLHEGIPVALIEAMGYGLPVVATKTGGIPELLGSDAGLLIPPGDPDALADSLEILIQDSGLREHLGERARQVVEEKFSIRRIVDVLEHLFATSVRGSKQSLHA